MPNNVTYICEQTLPNEIKTLQSTEVEYTLDNLAESMPYFAQVIGCQGRNKDGSFTSYLKTDSGKPIEETVFKQMIDSGFEFLTRPMTLIIDDEHVPVTDYCIPYRNPKAKLFLPTAGSICAACNVNIDFTYEVVFQTDDSEWFSYLYIPVKTGGSGAINLLDSISDLESILDDAQTIVEEIPNTKPSDDGGNYVQFPFTNAFGDFTHIDISVGELKDMVTSIRIVEMTTTITD